MTRSSNPVIETRLAAAVAVCAAQGAQLTALRRDVLGLILEADVPLTAYQLLDRLKETRKSAAPPSVYRALDFLLEQGLIHKIERSNVFVPCNQSDHAHATLPFLICTKCKAVVELEDHAIMQLLERAASRRQFGFTRATVEIEGVCAACSGLSRQTWSA